MAPFPYRVTRANAVAAVVEAVRSDPSFVAACLVLGGAHGYSMEMEYIERRGGPLRYRVWSDVQGIVHTEDRALAFDVSGALAAVRAAQLADVVLPDAPGAGRRCTIVLADPSGGLWIEAPTPGRGQLRGTGPLDRIFDVVFPP